MKGFFFIILNKHTPHCTYTMFRKIVVYSYTTLYKHDGLKVTVFLLFRKKSVVFEKSCMYTLAYVF